MTSTVLISKSDPAHLLKREAFTTNRALEFFTESELQPRSAMAFECGPPSSPRS